MSEQSFSDITEAIPAENYEPRTEHDVLLDRLSEIIAAQKQNPADASLQKEREKIEKTLRQPDLLSQVENEQRSSENLRRSEYRAGQSNDDSSAFSDVIAAFESQAEETFGSMETDTAETVAEAVPAGQQEYIEMDPEVLRETEEMFTLIDQTLEKLDGESPMVTDERARESLMGNIERLENWRDWMIGMMQKDQWVVLPRNDKLQKITWAVNNLHTLLESL